MANRYWVGGTADWDATAGTKWATTTGGAGGAAIPGTNDDVYFDANSGAVTITITVAVRVNNFDCTNFTGTFAGSVTLQVDNNILLYSGMTFSFSGTLHFGGGGGVNTLRTAGKTFSGSLWASGSNTSITLDGDYISTNTILWSMCPFNTGNFNVTCTDFHFTGSPIAILTLGSSILTCTSFFATGQYNDAGTSKIIITDGTFNGGGNTYYDLDTVNSVTITNNNTFHNIVAVGGSAHTLTLTGTTQTVTSFTATGTSTSDRLNILGGTISDTTGTNIATYCKMVNNTVSGGATFDATTCTNGGGNSGWIWDLLINPGNAFADDGSYATCAIAASGVISIKLSGDGGATFTSTLTKTVGSVEEQVTFGAGATELWGATFNGANMSDANFRLLIGCGSLTPETSYKTFGFVIPTVALTGIEIVVSAFYTSGTTTLSIDHIKVKAYYGTSTLPVNVGSQVFVSDGRKPGEGAGSGTGTIAYYDGIDWRSGETGSTVAA